MACTVLILCVALGEASSSAHRAPLANYSVHGADVTAMAFSEGGETFVTASADGTVGLWNASDGAHLGSFSRHSAEVTSVSLSGTTGVSVGLDHMLYVWDLNTLAVRTTVTMKSLPTSVYSTANLIVVGFESGTSTVWSANGTHVVDLPQRYPVTAVALSSDGHYVAATSLGGVCVWHVNGTVVFNESLGEALFTVVVAEGVLAVGGVGGYTYLWVLEEGVGGFSFAGRLHAKNAHGGAVPGGVTSTAVSVDSAQVVSGTVSGVQVFSRRYHTQMWEWYGGGVDGAAQHTRGHVAAQFPPGTRGVVAVALGGNVLFLDTTGEEEGSDVSVCHPKKTSPPPQL